jgi:hypothetical protein
MTHLLFFLWMGLALRRLPAAAGLPPMVHGIALFVHCPVEANEHRISLKQAASRVPASSDAILDMA